MEIPALKIDSVLSYDLDKFLVQEVISGNSEAFSALMMLYSKRVEYVGRKFFHNLTETEDFIQEVFLKAFNNIKTFRGESCFSTWLSRIAFTTAMNIRKAKRETQPIEEESIYSRFDTPEEEVKKQFIKKSVKIAVEQLPENCSRCIKLYFFRGMKYEDISDFLSIPVNTVKSYIFRGKKILEKKLNGIK